MVDVVFPIGLCGSTISNYILIDKLGEGSFGEVYLGQHNQTNELRALKIIYLKKIRNERN
jgi:serine/threonine protein kinase